MYNLSERSKNRLSGVHPFLVDTINMAISKSPEDFGIPMYGGLRTSIEKGEKPVTYTDGLRKKSNHQIKDGWGEAFDIYIYDHPTGRASWNVKRLTEVAIHLIKMSEIVKDQNPEYKGLNLTWGGNWKSWKDYPHFQIG